MALVFNISLYRVPVGPFANGGDIISVSPKLTTPKFTFYTWLSAKYLTSRNALENTNNFARCHFGMSRAQQVDMISVAPNTLHLDCVSIADALCRFHYDANNFLIQKGFSVLNRKHYVIVNLPSAMVSLPDFFHVQEGKTEQVPVASHGELQVNIQSD